MSDENSQTLSENLTAEKIEPEIQKTEDEEEILLEEEIFVDSKKKFTLRSFLKMSGITIIFLVVAAILMIAGLAVFYYTAAEPTRNVGFWLIVAGVVTFLLTMIFGFERIE